MRSQTLDILRTAAVVLVIGRHLTPAPDELNAGLRLVVEGWRRGGWVGVDLFFVLSGFLVAGLLFKEQRRYGSLRVKRFLIRRGFKIYPAFYVMLAATVAVRWVTGRSVPPAGLLREIFFLQNYGPGLHGHTWSLAVEEHFYLLLALVLAVGVAWHKRRRADLEREAFVWLPAFFVTVALFCLGMRFYVHTTQPFFTYGTHLTPTHLRLDSLLFGVLLSYFYHYRRTAWDNFTQRYRGPLTLLGLALLGPVFVVPLEHSTWLPTIGFTMVYLGSGALVSAWADYKPSESWLVRELAFTGAHSYSIYLWHASVMTWLAVGLRTRAGWLVYALVSVVGALAFGVLMARLIETPTLHLRERLFPSR